VATQITKKLPSSTTPLSFEALSRGTLANGRMRFIFPETRVIGLRFCRHLNLCTQAPKDASFMHQSAIWSFKVIQGRWFWCKWKARMRLPISRSLWLRSYLAPFLRYGDLLAKIAHFCYIFATPLSFGALVPYVPLGISGGSQETSHLATCGRSWSRFDMILACDRRSDRSSDAIYHS